MDAHLGGPHAGVGGAPLGFTIVVSLVLVLAFFFGLAFDVGRLFLHFLRGWGQLGERHEMVWADLRKKVFEHAEFAGLAAIIELKDLVNEKRLRMDVRQGMPRWALGWMGRTTVPPRRVDLSVLVVVHEPSADPTAS